MRESRPGSLPSLTTDRLELRPIYDGDLALLIALNADPAVMKYVRGRAATTDETAAEWQQRLTRQSDPGEVSYELTRTDWESRQTVQHR